NKPRTAEAGVEPDFESNPRTESWPLGRSLFHGTSGETRGSRRGAASRTGKRRSIRTQWKATDFCAQGSASELAALPDLPAQECDGSELLCLLRINALGKNAIEVVHDGTGCHRADTKHPIDW